MAYVMLGRSERLQDISIVRDKFDVSKIKCSEKAKEENDLLAERAEERKRRNNFFEEGKLNIGFINIRSMREHWQDFIADGSFQKCQVIGLCETWLHKDEEVNLEDYDAEVVNVGRGQGVAAFNNVQANVVYKFGSPKLSIIALEFRQWLVIFMYASQGAQSQDIISKLANLFCHASDIIVVGDMNWDYFGQDNAIKRFFQQNDFVQLIANPTHEQGGLLDHVYMRGGDSEKKVTVYQKARYYSDHDAILIKINVRICHICGLKHVQSHFTR